VRTVDRAGDGHAGDICRKPVAVIGVHHRIVDLPRGKVYVTYDQPIKVLLEADADCRLLMRP